MVNRLQTISSTSIASDFEGNERSVNVQFNQLQTISSASVASDRGGNERSVNVSKRSGYVSWEFKPNMCPRRFNQAWKTWYFQSNFML